MIISDTVRTTWLIRIRWAAVFAWTAVALISILVLKEQLQFVPFAIFFLLTVISNVVLAFSSKLIEEKFLPRAAGIIFFDIVLLTGLLASYGGYANPFSTMFLVYVTLAAFLLNARLTWCAFALSVIGFITIFFVHVPLSSLDVHHHSGSGGFSLHLHGMLVAFLVIGSLLSFFLTRMSTELSRRENLISELQRRKILEDNFVTIATMSAGAAHELSTPIATMALISEEFSRTIEKSSPLHEDTLLLAEQVQRCEEILHEMRGKSADYSNEKVVQIYVNEIEELLRAEFTKSSFSFHSSVDQLISYRKTLLDAIRSIVKNAVQAARTEQGVRIAIERSENLLQIKVEDDGDGVSPEVEKRIGEPFYTTKPPGEGFGLGVFLVRLFAQRVGGSFTISNRSTSNGTVAILSIPVMERV